MNERSLTTDLMDVMKVMYPKATIIKHSDRFTNGIPDLSVSVDGATTWLEVKYVRKGSTLREQVEAIQLLMCRLLARSTNGKCWIVAYYENPRRVCLVTPGAVAACKPEWGDALPAHTADGFDHSIVKQVLG